MTTDRDVEVCLFDLGGVLIDVSFERALSHWADAAGADARQLGTRLEFDDNFVGHERGTLEDVTFFEQLRQQLDIDLPLAQIAVGWQAVLGDEIEGIHEIVSGLRRRCRLAVLSNTNNAHHVVWRHRHGPLLEHFEAVFASNEIGARKPDPEAFEHVTRQLGVAPETVLFFDDSSLNIDAARAFGMRAHHVRDHADVIAGTRELLARESR